MKNLSKIILLICVFTVILFANVPNIDECKSDLYYANGILIQQSKRDARKMWEIKATKLLESNLELRKNIHSYLVAYNHSYGVTSDLFEAFIQKAEAEPGYKVTWEAFKLYVGLKIKKADDLLGMAENTSNSIENYDLTTQIEAYKNSIKNGHGVIVVSHSQGNLFTNRAYEKLEDWMKPYFHNMGVATPAGKVASDGPYVTFDNDPIHHIPGSLDDNIYNQNRYYLYTNALGENVEGLTGTFHTFNYYLGIPVLINNVSVSSNQASEKIKKFILEKIQIHLDASSQWETDQELNKGTEDFKITVKHRFDSSITSMNGIEVYPFAPSKKLYHVKDETGGNGWVKASCGGTEILDYWEEQKDNEFYLIDNIELEKIISLKKYKFSVSIVDNTVSYYIFSPSGTYLTRYEGGGINSIPAYKTYHKYSDIQYKEDINYFQCNKWNPKLYSGTYGSYSFDFGFTIYINDDFSLSSFYTSVKDNSDRRSMEMIDVHYSCNEDTGFTRTGTMQYRYYRYYGSNPLDYVNSIKGTLITNSINYLKTYLGE